MDLFDWSPVDARASLVAQMGKNLPGVQETLVRSLGQENSLEKEMATRSSSLGNPIDKEAWWATACGVTRVRHDSATKPLPP